MPGPGGPAQSGGAPVTNIRNNASPLATLARSRECKIYNRTNIFHFHTLFRTVPGVPQSFNSSDSSAQFRNLLFNSFLTFPLRLSYASVLNLKDEAMKLSEYVLLPPAIPELGKPTKVFREGKERTNIAELYRMSCIEALNDNINAFMFAHMFYSTWLITSTSQPLTIRIAFCQDVATKCIARLNSSLIDPAAPISVNNIFINKSPSLKFKDIQLSFFGNIISLYDFYDCAIDSQDESGRLFGIIIDQSWRGNIISCDNLRARHAVKTALRALDTASDCVLLD